MAASQPPPSPPAVPIDNLLAHASRGFAASPDSPRPPHEPSSLPGRLGVAALPVDKQKEMLSSLQSALGGFEDDSDPFGLGLGNVADHGPHEAKVDALKNVPSILEQMWLSDSQYLVRAAQILADGSRNSNWRRPLGDARVLDFFLSVTATEGVEHDLLVHALRLIGNCCADTDANRARVLQGHFLRSIMKLLKDESLLSVVIPVLYNICIDYEPAQQQAAEDGLARELVQLLSSKSFPINGPLTNYICQLLTLLIVSPIAIQSVPDNASEILFRVAKEPEQDFDDYIALVHCALTFLHESRFQKHLILEHAMELPLAILVESYSRFPSETLATPMSNLEISQVVQPEMPEQEKLLTELRSIIIKVLSEVSALNEFLEMYPLDCPLIGSLRMWLSMSYTQLQICACIILGNVARSDEVCKTMVEEFRIHTHLIAIIADSKDSQLLHASAGFLKNLALPAGNKEKLGEAGLIEVLPILWNAEILPQVQFAGASLARQVLNGSFTNVKRLLTPLSSDPDSPANAKTYLSLLLTLYDKSDQQPTHTEIARTITAICRVLNTANSLESAHDLENLTRLFYSLHTNLTKPLVDMVCQTKWPVIRSEGWFVLALIARNSQGAVAVNRALTSIEANQALLEVVSQGRTNAEDAGQEVSPSAEENDMKSKDRDNVLVMLTELLRNQGDEIGAVRKRNFENLLQGRYEAFEEYLESTLEE